MSHSNQERIFRLERRAAYLAKRIAEAEGYGGDVSYDKGELSALEWAVGCVNQLRQAQAERDQATRELAQLDQLLKEYMLGPHTGVKDRLRNLLQAYVTERNNAGEAMRQLAAKEAECCRLRGVLGQISEGRGQYSLDPFEHCRNTVEDMKQLAINVLGTSTTPCPHQERVKELEQSAQRVLCDWKAHNELFEAVQRGTPRKE